MGRYMVRQAFRLEGAFLCKLGKGPGMEGHTRPHDVLRGGGGFPVEISSHDSAFPLRLPARSHSCKKENERKRNSCSQCSKGGSRLSQEGKSQRAWISQDSFLLPARGA